MTYWKELLVEVNGDQKYEKTDTFKLQLFNLFEATFADSLGLGIIINDDALPTVTIADASVAEGNIVGGTLTFPVTISNPTMTDLAISYALTDGTAIGSADFDNTAGSDTIRAGKTSLNISVAVTGDLQVEANETFTITLTPEAGKTTAAGSDLTATGTILNDDDASDLKLTIADDSVIEGNSGTTDTLRFIVSLSDASINNVKVSYSVRNGSASLTENDYENVAGTLTFSPGTRTQTVKVPVNGDTRYEGNETLFVTLSNPDSAGISDAEAIGTINDDDNIPTVALSSVNSSVDEGLTGQTPISFEVTLTNPSVQTIRVSYSTSDSTATISNNDYVAGNGTVVFAPGDTIETIVISVQGDAMYEKDDSFKVELSSPVNATFRDSEGIWRNQK